MQKQVETEKPTRKRLPRSLGKRDFSGSEFFEDFDLSKIKFPEDRKTKKKKRALCGKILNAFFDLAIQDVIDHNAILILPTNKNIPTYISVKPINGALFKKLYVNGRFSGLDFLKTNFTAPGLVFTYKDKNGQQNTPLTFFNEETKERIINNANNGVYN